MSTLIGEFDWSRTLLGPIEHWPQSLKTSVGLILTSRHPMWIGWGTEMTFLYNDAYVHVLGAAKHPWALACPAAEVWSEIWDICGPLARKVFETGEASFVDEVRLLMKRGDFLEETFYSFSYSPIRDEAGEVGGLFCPSTDVTPKVLSARRLRTLSELSANALLAASTSAACATSAHTLSKNPDDIPFGVLYVVNEEGSQATLEQVIGTLGIAPLPQSIDLTAPPQPAQWPVALVFNSGQQLVMSVREIDGLPAGAAGQRLSQAVVLPVASRGEDKPCGVLVLGVNPCCRLNTEYMTFLELIAGQVGAGIQNARAIEEQQRRVDTLAELDRVKTAFFSNVSHEFRTPLTLMLAPLEELLSEPGATVPAERETLELIHRNGLRLLKLVNHLLDFSRMEAGRTQANYERTNLSTATEELASMFRSAVEKAGLQFVVDCAPLPEPVYVDREMWEKIVLNLLSNAVKFTFEGSIRVTLRPVNRHVELRVEDTGVGIPEEHLPHVFERFHRVLDTRSRSYEGTGIGLALVHELVHLHSGTVRVVSKVGAGTTFTVSLPLGSAHLPQQQVSDPRTWRSTAVRSEAYVQEALRWLPTGGAEDVPGAPGEQSREPAGRIVIADDNSDVREYLRHLLSGQYEVTAVSNGEEVLELLRTKPLPDLVLTDVMMPIVDGFQLVARLREDPRTRHVPIIMLSARAGEEARVDGFHSGADDYVVKPFTARELVARVQSQIALARVRKSAETQLLAAEEHLRLAMEASNLGSWEFRIADSTLHASAKYKEMFGIAQDSDVTVATVLQRVDPADQPRVERLMAGMKAATPGSAYNFEHRVLLPDGETRWVSVNGEAVTAVSETGAESTRIVGTIRDVTEERRREESLRETQKLESLGLLAGGIAHDFNNLLTGVVGNGSLLLGDLPSTGEKTELLQAILSAAERMSRLTSQMLAYSGRGRFFVEPIDLSKQVTQITSLIHSSIPKNVQLKLSLACDLPLISADSSQLQQIVMNLVINAAESIGDKSGTVEVKTAVAHVGAKEISANVTRQNCPPGDYVVLVVRDTGSGMSPDLRDKIFDPFFTTKFTGRGLGLSAVLGIVRSHQGLMVVESELGAGSTFSVYFPKTSMRAQSPVKSVDVPHGEGTILVVDDEEVVRSMARSALTRLGYQVITAANGEEALRIHKAEKDRISAVLLDMTMPVMSGEQALGRFAEVQPDVVVIAMSGYDESEAHQRFGNRIAGFVQKPFTVSQLGFRLASALHPAVRKA